MFRLKNACSEIFVPDRVSLNRSLRRTTHMGIGAHQDDLEIMAAQGILDCFGGNKRSFFGVTVTDGSGNPRNKRTASLSRQEMSALRNREQKKAAVMGDYSGVVLLGYKSDEVKNPKVSFVKDDLKELISGARPEVIYTHNLADTHDTHVSIALRTLEALRELPQRAMPRKLYGCEVWGGLDWLRDKDKIALDVSGYENLASALLGVFDSQISGGKRYDLASLGRRRANATFLSHRGKDIYSGVIFAMDLMPLIKNTSLNIEEFVSSSIERFRRAVLQRIRDLR